MTTQEIILPKKTGWWKVKYNFADMKVNDFIEVESDNANSISTASRQYANSLKVKKSERPKFSTQKAENGKHRCFRIK